DFGSEEDDDDFNPQPADNSDDEQNKKTAAASEDDKPVKRRMSDSGLAQTDGTHDVDGNDVKAADPEQNDNDEEEEGNGAEEAEGEDDDGGNAAGDDDEEDEEEEDEDEDGDDGRPRKKRRGHQVSAFFEEEAEVDEDDDVVDEEEEEMGEFLAEEHPDDVDLLPSADRDDHRHRELDRQRDLEASMDAEQKAQEYKERYGRNRAAAADLAIVPKRLLLPSVNDPSIWAVKCRPGKEKEVVFSIQKRIEERRTNSRKPCRIISAFERGSMMQGYVYVEANRHADVIEGLDEILNLYVRSKMTLISISEMPDLLRVRKDELLEPNQWVRIKRGKYAGDLAVVEDVETNGLDVTVRLVPRLDYGLNEDALAPGDQKRKRPVAFTAANRPPQRLFSEGEAKKKHAKYLSSTAGLGSKSWTYLNETYVDGFLIKDMKINHLITKDVNPQLDEITLLAKGGADGSANVDITALAASKKNTTNQDAFLPGETVEVFDGEQAGVVGSVVSTHQDIVTLSVTQGELLNREIDAPVKSLRKRFSEGDHVKVVGGSSHRDELGMVVKIDGEKVTLISDMTFHDIEVFSTDLRLAADAGVDGKLGNYDVQDLVQLDHSTVGCVVRLDRESMKVLDQYGSLRTIQPSQVSGKLEPQRNAISTDRMGAEIRIGDTVREYSGEQRTAVILHIYSSFLFLHSKAMIGHAGIFVTRANNVTSISGGLRSRVPDLSKPNTSAYGRNNSTPAASGPMAAPRGGGRDRLIGQTVSARRGEYKGLIGIVKAATDVYARVELHSKNQWVNIPRNDLILKDPITGQKIDPAAVFGRGRGIGGAPPMRAGPGGPGAFAGRGSWAPSGSRTTALAPAGSRTPAWGGSARTPVWTSNLSSRTPAWNTNDGSRTAYGGGTSYGGSTAYGGSTSYGGFHSSRTPAWNAGSKTPYGGGDAFGMGSGSRGHDSSGDDPFALGSRTPAIGGLGSAAPPARTPVVHSGGGFDDDYVPKKEGWEGPEDSGPHYEE
ncbi:transcription elongation factor spt5, partial [Ascosphaera aggregata]